MSLRQKFKNNEEILITEQEEYNIEDINYLQEMTHESSITLESELNVFKDLCEVEDLCTEAHISDNASDLLNKAVYLAGLEDKYDLSIVNRNMSSKDIEFVTEGLGAMYFNAFSEASNFINNIFRKLKEWIINFVNWVKKLFSSRRRNIENFKAVVDRYVASLSRPEFKNVDIFDISPKYKEKFNSSLRRLIFSISRVVPEGHEKAYKNPFQLMDMVEGHEKDGKILLTPNQMIPIFNTLLREVKEDYNILAKTKITYRKHLLSDLTAGIQFRMTPNGLKVEPKELKPNNGARFTKEEYIYLPVVDYGLHIDRIKLYAGKDDKIKTHHFNGTELYGLECNALGRNLKFFLKVYEDCSNIINSSNAAKLNFLSFEQKVNTLIYRDFKSYSYFMCNAWKNLNEIYKNLSDFCYYIIMSVTAYGYREIDKFKDKAPDDALKLEHKK